MIKQQEGDDCEYANLTYQRARAWPIVQRGEFYALDVFNLDVFNFKGSLARCVWLFCGAGGRYSPPRVIRPGLMPVCIWRRYLGGTHLSSPWPSSALERTVPLPRASACHGTTHFQKSIPREIQPGFLLSVQNDAVKRKPHELASLLLYK